MFNSSAFLETSRKLSMGLLHSSVQENQVDRHDHNSVNERNVAKLPSPQHRNKVPPTPMREGNPFDSSLFASNVNVRETSGRTVFTPSAPALIEISRNTHEVIRSSSLEIGKVLLLECFDYYNVVLLWLRICSLKSTNSHPMSAVEKHFLKLQSVQLCVLDPIWHQLKTLGNVETTTKEHLYPVFPPMPVAVINHFGGYYGRINNGNHILYEEITCLGVIAEAIRQAVSDAPAGAYISNVGTAQLVMTDHLLGFKPLTVRRNEAKNLPMQAGIDLDVFPEYPNHSAVNFELITVVSNILEKVVVLKSRMVKIPELPSIGHPAQLFIQTPNPVLKVRAIDGEAHASSLSQDPPSSFGLALYLLLNLRKSQSPPMCRTNLPNK